jgi:hypothetical protein
VANNAAAQNTAAPQAAAARMEASLASTRPRGASTAPVETAATPYSEMIGKCVWGCTSNRNSVDNWTLGVVLDPKFISESQKVTVRSKFQADQPRLPVRDITAAAGSTVLRYFRQK